MKNKLYLHIGANKTGSSAIQLFLVKNRSELKAAGYCYPKFGELYNAHYHISSALGCGPNVKAEELETLSEKMLEECGDNACILSSEYFITVNDVTRIYHTFSKSFDIEVIVYFRRHDLWFESLYNQAVKTVVNPPWGKGIESYLNYQWKKGGQSFSYLKIIDVWTKYEDIKITVRPYEKESFVNGDIINDFMGVLGVNDTSGFDKNIGTVNESIPTDFLDMVDTVNRTEALSLEEKNRIIRGVYRISGNESNDNSGHSMTPVHRKIVLGNQAKSYSMICDKLKIDEPFFKNMNVDDSNWKVPVKFNVEQSIITMNLLIRSYE
jgi:hypothetical protein